MLMGRNWGNIGCIMTYFGQKKGRRRYWTSKVRMSGLQGVEEELNTPGKKFWLGSSGTMGHRGRLANRPGPEALLFTRLNLHWARATWPESLPGVGFVSEPPEGSADGKAAYLVRSVSGHSTYQDHEKRNCDSNAHVCQRLKKKKKISRSIV